MILVVQCVDCCSIVCRGLVIRQTLSFAAMANIPRLEFNHLLSFFPETDLPVTLTVETIHNFQAQNDLLPEATIEVLTSQTEPEEIDKFTEYVPYLRFKETHEFHALVYWRAKLLKYEYFLATFDKNGKLISHAVIAGMRSEGDQIIQSVATIDPDWIIHIVEGEMAISEKEYKASSSKAYYMEVLPTGEIIFLLNEEGLV